METQTINIITRTSNRPNHYRECYDSVKEQDLSKIEQNVSVCHWTTSDDDATFNYLHEKYDNIRIVKCSRPKRKNMNHFPYHRYLGQVVNLIDNDGWVLILDDDHTLANSNSLSTIFRVLAENDFSREKVYVWQVKMPNNEILPSRESLQSAQLTIDEIVFSSYLFHVSKAREVKFEPKVHGEYDYLQTLMGNLDFVPIYETLVNINGTGGGYRIDKMINDTSSNVHISNNSLTSSKSPTINEEVSVDMHIQSIIREDKNNDVISNDVTAVHMDSDTYSLQLRPKISLKSKRTLVKLVYNHSDDPESQTSTEITSIDAIETVDLEECNNKEDHVRPDKLDQISAINIIASNVETDMIVPNTTTVIPTLIEVQTYPVCEMPVCKAMSSELTQDEEIEVIKIDETDTWSTNEPLSNKSGEHNVNRQRELAVKIGTGVTSTHLPSDMLSELTGGKVMDLLEDLFRDLRELKETVHLFQRNENRQYEQFRSMLNQSIAQIRHETIESLKARDTNNMALNRATTINSETSKDIQVQGRLKIADNLPIQQSKDNKIEKDVKDKVEPNEYNQEENSNTLLDYLYLVGETQTRTDLLNQLGEIANYRVLPKKGRKFNAIMREIITDARNHGYANIGVIMIDETILNKKFRSILQKVLEGKPKDCGVIGFCHKILPVQRLEWSRLEPKYEDYLTLYDDVQDSDPGKIQEHWKYHGIMEGRPPFIRCEKSPRGIESKYGFILTESAIERLAEMLSGRNDAGSQSTVGSGTFNHQNDILKDYQRHYGNGYYTVPNLSIEKESTTKQIMKICTANRWYANFFL